MVALCKRKKKRMSCVYFVCGPISMLLTLYIGRIKNVLAAVKISCVGSFLCLIVFFFGKLLKVDSRRMCSDL